MKRTSSRKMLSWRAGARKAGSFSICAAMMKSGPMENMTRNWIRSGCTCERAMQRRYELADVGLELTVERDTQERGRHGEVARQQRIESRVSKAEKIAWSQHAIDDGLHGHDAVLHQPLRFAQ